MTGSFQVFEKQNPQRSANVVVKFTIIYWKYMHATNFAYIFQTLFQHGVFVITPTLNAGSRCHVMLVMATR
jgi:hypothetical protein